MHKKKNNESNPDRRRDHVSRESTFEQGDSLIIESIAGEWLFWLLGSFLVFFGAVEVLTILFSLCRVPIFQLIALVIILASALTGIWYGSILKRDRRKRVSPEKFAQKGAWFTIPACIMVVLLYGLLWAIAYLVPDSSHVIYTVRTFTTFNRT